tara:strand:+ start:114 stop:251 length:138 start_codon:yes stop_codon:yes gene_type:complete
MVKQMKEKFAFKSETTKKQKPANSKSPSNDNFKNSTALREINQKN